MKKVYTKPVIEIEVYKLDANIAANCGTTISLGPEAPGKVICEEFKDAFDVASYGLAKSTDNRSFYDDGSANCDCYYSSGGNSYFTS